MLADIESGHFDAVVAYHQDRLTRRPSEFENFLTICDRAGVRHFASVTGYTELGHGDGIMVARIYAAVAANQSDAASRRIRRKNDERAAQGIPHISGSRAYGYALDRKTVIESEAQVIRDAAERFIAGEWLNSITETLKSSGIKTATGQNDWRTPTLRNLIKSPRIAGLREHRGEVVGDAAWPPIITLQQHEQIKHRLTANAVTGKGHPVATYFQGRSFAGFVAPRCSPLRPIKGDGATRASAVQTSEAAARSI
jgi:site-specific DNA recombinase